MLNARVALVMMGLLILGMAGRSAEAQETFDAGDHGATSSRSVSAEVGFAVYLWMPSIGGHSAVDGSGVDVDASFFDLLDETDSLIGFMGHAELNLNRFLILLDPVWTRMEKDDAGSADDQFDLTLDSLWFDIDAGYRFIDRQPLGGEDSSTHISVDGLVGIRLTSLELHVNRPGRDNDLSPTEYWIDPLVGGRVVLGLGEHWGMTLRGDIGGFGAGSELSANMMGAFGYRFPIGDAEGAIFVGYRALYQDYEDGGFEWRAWVHGPALGFQITF